ncbi:MbtH family NRPS accessory protein [Streptomyces platensis]|uniref:MbtH family NRPS accessory protein n=1 Tax=Streptomyces platensis TaxID=58346 RepID=UPI003C2E96E5
MTTPSAPFAPGPDGHTTHLLLENPHGHLSLWPSWRETPEGWTACFGPASHDACMRRVGAVRG